MKETILPLYAQAVDELNLQTYDRGLYGKALCDANGDESLARVYYIRTRVAHIIKANKRMGIPMKAADHSLAAQPPRFRVRRRRSETTAEETVPATSESSSFEHSHSTFRFRRSYSSMVNLFVRWTSL